MTGVTGLGGVTLVVATLGATVLGAATPGVTSFGGVASTVGVDVETGGFMVVAAGGVLDVTWAKAGAASDIARTLIS